MERGFYRFFLGQAPRRVISMSAVAEILETAVHRELDLFQMIKDSPVALAIVQRPGKLKAFNTAFDRLLNVGSNRKPMLLTDLVPVQNRKEAEELFSDYFGALESDSSSKLRPQSHKTGSCSGLRGLQIPRRRISNGSSFRWKTVQISRWRNSVCVRQRSWRW